MSAYIDDLEGQINNTMELSSICRGEWCRSLESKIDDLRNQLAMVSLWEAADETERLGKMSNKIRKAYRYLSPDIHI